MKKLFVVILFFILFYSKCMANFNTYNVYNHPYDHCPSYNNKNNNSCCRDYMDDFCKRYLEECPGDWYYKSNKNEIKEMEEYPLKNKVKKYLKKTKNVLKKNKLKYSISVGLETASKNISTLKNGSFIVSKTMDFLDLLDLMLEADEMRE